jgi:hypothetical protein
MNDLKRDIVISLLFIVGLGSFLLGQFVLSTLIFASVAIYSNIQMKAHL